VNPTFTLASAPSPAASLALTINGLEQALAINYTLVGRVITYLTTPPGPYDVQRASYRYYQTPTPTTQPGAFNVLSDIIYFALRLIGVIQESGRTASAYRIADVLGALNGMLDAWNTERRTVWGMLANTYGLTAGQQSYAIGSSSIGTVDIDFPRPSRIDAASMVLPNAGTGQALELFMNRLEWDDWQRIPIKNVPSSLATSYYYDQADPIGNISLFPVPNVANQLRLYLWQVLTTFASEQDTVFLPPGYLRAIRYNLAVEIADMFPTATLKPATTAIAMESKAKLKTLNQPPIGMSCDPAALSQGGGRYNFYTDQTHR
jgi:hypothetical protein